MSSTEWQDAILYHAIWGKAQEAFSLITVDDFDPGDRMELAALVERGYLDGKLEPPWVKDEAIRLGRPSVNYVVNVIAAGFAGTVGYYANRLREESIRRKAEEALTRGLQRIRVNDVDASEVVMDVQNELNALPQIAVSDDDAWTIQEIMALEQTFDDFVLPNLLRTNERLVLTGSEGGGKSVFIYQLLTGAAFGVDTFTLEKTEPKRVLFIDVENNEFQAKNNLDKIVPYLSGVAPEVTPEWRSLKRRVIDLLASRDRADIIRRVTHYNPELLYLGTAYKLTDMTDETHRSVRAIQSVVDRIREEIGCSVIVEHHAGHGLNNDRNGMRPEGSSYWLRWPDFGYGMQPLRTTDGTRLMRLAPWRGDRSTDRNFPVAVKSDNVLPWRPIYADEWDALYAEKYE